LVKEFPKGILCYKCRKIGYLVEEKEAYLRVVHNIKKNKKWITRFCYVGSPEKAIRFLEENEDTLHNNPDFKKAMLWIEALEHNISDTFLVKVVLELRELEKRLRKKLASA